MPSILSSTQTSPWDEDKCSEHNVCSAPSSNSDGLRTPRSLEYAVDEGKFEGSDVPNEPERWIERNVWVRDGVTFEVVAGFMQYGDTTVATFYQWLDVVFSSEPVAWMLFYCRKDEGSYQPYGKPLPPQSDTVFPLGEFLLLSEEGTPFIPKPKTCEYMPRLPTGRSTPISCPKEQAARLFKRDKLCCVTGEVIRNQYTTGFEAAHIIPLSRKDRWAALATEGYLDACRLDPNAKMDSFDNLLVMTGSAHRLFCAHQLAFDPFDNWRILHFARSLRGRARSHLVLDHCTKIDELHKTLLFDHYEQTILCNVQGDGSNTVRWYRDPFDDAEIDFSDAEWSTVPGKVYVELQLATRLYHANFEEWRPNLWERRETKVVDHYDLASRPSTPQWAPLASPSHPKHHLLTARDMSILKRCYEKQRASRPFQNFGMD